MDQQVRILGVREGSGDRIVTLDELNRRPDPEPMGRHHAPVRYDEAICRLYDSLNVMNFDIGESQFALCRKESVLMGLIEVGKDSQNGLEQRKLLGLRMSEVQAVGFKLVAGRAVMLCTNLMLSAHDILVNLKQTIHANIKKAITAGVANFMIQAGHLDRRLDELARTSYSDQMAKAVMCDLAVTAVAPNYLKDAYTAYFEEKPEDCSPRSAWGVMNAWTRALRKANGVTKVEHTQAVAKYFDC